MNILIVDDNDNNIMVLKLLLEDYSQEHEVNFNIDEAKDGVEAVNMSLENNYDIVFMDIMMPNMNGIEATKAIRNSNSEVMIIAVSAVDDDIRQKQILNNGAEDYISKPVKSDLFASRISNYITLVKSRSHERKNEYYVNLYTSEIYSRNTKFMIYCEDSLSEFWEFFLLNAQKKYDGLSDVVRSLFSVAEAQVKLSIDSGIYIEESDDKQYFTLTNINKLPSKMLKNILKRNEISIGYKIEDSKISFELNKTYSTLEDDENNEFKELQSPKQIEETITIPLLEDNDSNNKVIQEHEYVDTHVSKELLVLDYMDEDDLIDLEEYSNKLNSLMLVAGSEDITQEEIQDIYTYLDRISSILSTYAEVYPISNALSELSNDMSSHSQEFAENSEALGPMCKAFSIDMSSWVQQSFYTGAPSADFMNDTIVVNCKTIGSMLKMNDDVPEGEEEEFDDIFDF